MIDPRELRIGNWLNFKHLQGYITEFKTGGVEIKCGNILVRADWEDLSPIELTPEWLERGGFIGDTIFGIQTLYKKGTFELWFSEKEGALINNLKHIKCYVKHVHKLQNVWYELTGTELEFKQ